MRNKMNELLYTKLVIVWTAVLLSMILNVAHKKPAALEQPVGIIQLVVR